MPGPPPLRPCPALLRLLPRYPPHARCWSHCEEPSPALSLLSERARHLLPIPAPQEEQQGLLAFETQCRTHGDQVSTHSGAAIFNRPESSVPLTAET
ncbi:hypothetical protein NDU88_003312 [Pleurodeles waltl]|uniref:Uncharacterized protein n=1 Tax=Pleurodeles waltl TaxID=8319 RepID=A0AAV7WNS2_PLEWA|nr:hypothetical protein NDU88_003312 [Pleurodeles waltl]